MDRKERINTCLHYNMSFVGGFFGVYAVLLCGMMASAQTLNLLDFVIDLLGGDTAQMLLHLGATVVYVIAVVLVTRLRRRWDMRPVSLAVDALAALAMMYLPARTPPVMHLYPCFFAMAFQWCNFSGAQGFTSSSIFSTNNLRIFVSSMTEVYLNHEPSFLPRAKFFGFTLLSFHLGVAYCFFAWKIFALAAGWFSLLPLGVAAVFLRQEKCLTAQEEKPLCP